MGEQKKDKGLIHIFFDTPLNPPRPSRIYIFQVLVFET